MVRCTFWSFQPIAIYKGDFRLILLISCIKIMTLQRPDAAMPLVRVYGSCNTACRLIFPRCLLRNPLPISKNSCLQKYSTRVQWTYDLKSSFTSYAAFSEQLVNYTETGWKILIFQSEDYSAMSVKLESSTNQGCVSAWQPSMFHRSHRLHVSQIYGRPEWELRTRLHSLYATGK